MIERETPARDSRAASELTGIPASRPAARHIGRRPGAYDQPGAPSAPYGQPGSFPMNRGPQRPAPRPGPVPVFLTVKEVAAKMRVSKMTVYRMLHSGEMESVRIGRSFRVSENVLAAYLGTLVTEVPLVSEA
jgi:excisionase family DNA binding protein